VATNDPPEWKPSAWNLLMHAVFSVEWKNRRNPFAERCHSIRCAESRHKRIAFLNTLLCGKIIEREDEPITFPIILT